jgi:hypothetical protein
LWLLNFSIPEERLVERRRADIPECPQRGRFPTFLRGS